ncbi:MAG: DUF1513 domain-containing protein [Rhodobacteraceae bacterium]|nr:DUF1513 domain-containing protein [Paracoccaceae bacterium]
MATRRRVLAGLLASGLMPAASWADAGSPAYLAAARRSDGRFILVGLTVDGMPLFDLPLPARGHAAAAHPVRPEAVAFARRPGRFALVLDCSTGGLLARLDAPPGRHFYGHGAFSVDGTRLFTTENDYGAAQGMIGIWDAAREYRRLGEFPSGGVGPHDLLRLPGSDQLVVANGGIETHPDSGRAKLNLPAMRPNLSYLDPHGTLLEQVAPDPALHMNSIRHLAVAPDGTVAIAFQWQGDPYDAPPLLALHRRGVPLTYCEAPPPLHRQMHGYGGSIAVSESGDEVAITSPRGGMVQVFDLALGAFVAAHELADVCGVSAQKSGFLVTTGTGAVHGLRGDVLRSAGSHALQWDNHLVGLAQI